MNVIEMGIDELIPYDNNPRNNDEAVEKVALSISSFGFKVPIVIDQNNVIVTGHTRLKAAKKLGLSTVPCIKADDLTDEQIKAFRLADNKVGEIAEWDFEKLAEELENIEMDMSLFGFERLIEDGGGSEIIEDEPPEEVETRCQLGDIWKLGHHRLMCGDSTKKKDVQKLMNGQKVDMFLTDPPYNVDYQGGTKDALKIMNDSMEDTAFREFLTDAFKNANLVMKDGAAYYIWHADLEGLNFRCAIRNAGWQLKQTLIWVKNSLVLGRQDYQWKHEPCLYGWKDGTHYFTDDRTNSTVYEDKIDIKKLKKNEMEALLKELLEDKVPTTVIHEDKPVVNDVHPTMKPVKLMAKVIRNSSKEGQIILDLFGGSGSTLIACQQTGRQCYTMELDPHYCDVIVQRWEDFTGEKAELLS